MKEDTPVNKYEKALSLYKTAINDNKVKEEVENILKEKTKENDTEKVKKLLFNCIDLTSLKIEDNDKSIMDFTKKVNQFDNDYPDIKNVASICVYPNFSEIVKATLEVEDVGITCVAGSFPSSQTFMEIKIAEVAMAIKEGADEIDIVLPIGKFLAKNYEELSDEINEIKEVCKEHTLKVILETGTLKTSKNIKQAAILAMYAGADFIKTSTGKEQPAATPEAAYIMCQAIKEYYEKTGKKIGFKPAGGINTVEEAINYYTIVKEILGEEWLNNKLFRLGTSKLANLLLSEIENEDIKFF